MNLKDRIFLAFVASCIVNTTSGLVESIAVLIALAFLAVLFELV